MAHRARDRGAADRERAFRHRFAAGVDDLRQPGLVILLGADGSRDRRPGELGSCGRQIGAAEPGCDFSCVAAVLRMRRVFEVHCRPEFKR